MENLNSLAGIGGFLDRRGQFFLDQDSRDNSAHDLSADFHTVFPDCAPRISVSQDLNEPSSSWISWHAADANTPLHSFHPSLEADSADELYKSRMVAGLEQAGGSSFSIAIWPDNCEKFVVEPNFCSTPNLAQTGQQEHCFITNSTSGTPGSWTPISDVGTLLGTPIETTKLAELAVPTVPKSHKRKTKTSKDAEAFLRHAFSTCYYPDKDHVALLSKQISLTEKQVKIWFSNQRQRGNSRSRSAHALTRTSIERMNEQNDQSDAANRHTHSLLNGALHALHAVDPPMSGRVSAPPELNARYPPHCSSSRASSVHSGQSSNGSNGSVVSRLSRKGRLRFPKSRKQKNDELRTQTFVCTFGCGASFPSDYGWERHETSVHMPRETWTCNHPSISYLPELCPYDLTEFPTASHLASHRHDTCIRNHPDARTFYRKDNLLQHLRGTHRVTDTAQMARTIKSWRESVPPLIPSDPALHCGFCGTTLAGWDDRVAHVREHFKEGKQFVDWWPSRLNTTLDLAGMLPEPPLPGFDPTEPVNCLACGAIFDTLWTAQTDHIICRFYSCRFLTKVEETSSYGGMFGAQCVYCGKWNKSNQGLHLEETHKFRGCKQHIFMSEQKFRDHLEDVHLAIHSEGSNIWNNMSRLFSEPNLMVKPTFAPWPAEFGFTCSPLDGLHIGFSGDVCECELLA